MVLRHCKRCNVELNDDKRYVFCQRPTQCYKDRLKEAVKRSQDKKKAMLTQELVNVGENNPQQPTTPNEA